MPKTARHLDELLARLDPARRAGLGRPEVVRALDDLADDITSSARRPARYASIRPARAGSGRRLVLALGVVVLAITAGGATAAMWSAHTGVFPDSAELRALERDPASLAGPGEKLDPSAPDFRAVAARLASDIEFPPGYGAWREHAISTQVTRSAPNERISAGALHGWLAASAFCAWVRMWRDARDAGDRAVAARAARAISSAPGWRAIRDEDPHLRQAVQGDAAQTRPTLFGWLLAYRDAVRADDRARVEHLLTVDHGGKAWESDPGWNARLAAHDDWRDLTRAELRQRYAAFLAGGPS
jgi:hypothetical protein